MGSSGFWGRSFGVLEVVIFLFFLPPNFSSTPTTVITFSRSLHPFYMYYLLPSSVPFFGIILGSSGVVREVFYSRMGLLRDPISPPVFFSGPRHFSVLPILASVLLILPYAVRSFLGALFCGVLGVLSS